MPVPNITLPGSINNDVANPTELFLVQFSGEVISAFERAHQFRGLHMTKAVGAGRSHQFPGHGRATARFLPRGVNLLVDNNGTSVLNNTEALVAVDRPTVADTFIDEQDMLLNHWEERQAYADELGLALAAHRESLVLQAITRSSRHASPSDLIPNDADPTVFDGGFVASTPSPRTPAELLTALIDAAQIMDEKSIPRDGRRIAPLTPADYWLLVQNTDLLNRDFGNQGNGVHAMGEILFAAGLRLVMTVFMPSTNIAANPAGASNTYTGNFTELVSPVFWWDAAGTVYRMEPTVESEYRLEAQGWPIVAKMSAGTSAVRPASAVEVSEAAAQPAL